jgi:cephalosporin-C deacetylase-like acetyl esterase
MPLSFNYLKILKKTLFFIALLTAALPLSGISQSLPPAEIFTVNKCIPLIGKQITPLLQYQVDTAWAFDNIRRERFAGIRTEKELLQVQQELYGKLIDMIGGLPSGKTPLNPQIIGTIPMDGYRIEKLIFESLPGYHVTAHVYVPDAPSSPKPAVLLASGHAPEGKSYYENQLIAGRLAKRGYVVLCWDTVGQAERSQYWDKKQSASKYDLWCGEHAIIGNLANLTGANLARWEVWDGIRALDYLISRPEVDSARISITGTSGGGFQSATIGAIDRRIGVIAPSCWVCALPMRMNNRIFEDADSDPEQDIYRMVSSGIDHPGLMLLAYPRPVILNAAVYDFFPIEGTRKTYREAYSIYERFGIPERIAITEGFHGHQYSDWNQERAFNFLDRFNGLPVHGGLDSTKVLDYASLQCTHSGQVSIDFPDETMLTGLIKQYFLERKGNIKKNLGDLYFGDYYPGIKNWPVVPYDRKKPLHTIAWEAAGTSSFDSYTVDRYILHHSGILSIPLVYIHNPKESSKKALMIFGPNGKIASTDWPEIKNYLAQGYDIVSFDFRGTGEDMMRYATAPLDENLPAKEAFTQRYYNPRSSVMANYVYNSQLCGRPYFLQMIEDAEITSRFIAQKLGLSQIYVTGFGDAYTIASGIADVFSSIKLVARNEQIIKWSELVGNEQESWPVQFMIPGGAYIK